MDIILTHENADFDAVAALLAAHKLNPSAVPVLPARINQNVTDFVTLYQNGLPFVHQPYFRAKTIDRVTLVDTQRPPSLRKIKPTTPIHIIDHHPLSHDLKPHDTFSGELVGATTTLLVEDIRRQAIAVNSLEATLLALGIYEDTGSLVYGTTTPRDLVAAAWLLEQNAVVETIRRFLAPPLNDEQQRLLDTLIKTADSRTIQGFTITVATTELDAYVAEISSVAHRLRDILNPAALFVLVQMPGSLQLIGRAVGGVVDVGEIARSFGGGGHEFASAANIRDHKLEEIVALLWEQIFRLIRPATRVADLMSFGVQTVSPDRQMAEIIPQLRRIGHEGFPVVESGKVIGLLTRRDADRAVEHALGNLTVREIMSSGAVTLKSGDSVFTLEQLMVESGWGQIPVLDENGNLIGIVTRTDLIKHWAQSHPPAQLQLDILPSGQIKEVLGDQVNTLIHTVAVDAQNAGVTLYLVGGIVRDLLLKRPNLDIDFVVEGDAIQFAQSLEDRYGGKVSDHPPFGTAKWILDARVANRLHVEPDMLPDHIDFASARNEFYEHPTALPTVYNSSIKLDLQRRDFTINAIAVQMSPLGSMGRILDFYGGLNDLQAAVIRVLHSLSFVDDPTRILRAVRLSQRLGFIIEPRTAELIQTALPMLRRITGQRVKNELTLLLREKEPEQGLLKLDSLGALEAIHPDFKANRSIVNHFQTARSIELPWPMAMPEMIDVYWHIIAIGTPIERLHPVLDRLSFGRTDTQSMLQAADLVQRSRWLADSQARTSSVVNELADKTELALLTSWLFIESPLARERIQRYMLEWQHIQPKTNGHTLQAKGVKPGPCYAKILKRLQQARLDSEIRTDDEELRLLNQLIEELCNGNT